MFHGFRLQVHGERSGETELTATIEGEGIEFRMRGKKVFSADWEEFSQSVIRAVYATNFGSSLEAEGWTEPPEDEGGPHGGA